MNAEKKLEELPQYINSQLDSILIDWLKTEKECHEEGYMNYSAKDRMAASLENALKQGSVNSAIQNVGKYKWHDYWLGVAGQGLFTDQKFIIKATAIALETIKIWKDEKLLN